MAEFAVVFALLLLADISSELNKIRKHLTGESRKKLIVP